MAGVPCLGDGYLVTEAVASLPNQHAYRTANLNVWSTVNLGVGLLQCAILWCQSLLLPRDEDYEIAIQKLEGAGYIPSIPFRKPAPEIPARLPDPDDVVKVMNAGYKRLDRSSMSFEYQPQSPASSLRVCLFPDPPPIFFHVIPLLREFVKATIDEENEIAWSDSNESLRPWESMMSAYLEVDNDILNNCADERAVEWYRNNFGHAKPSLDPGTGESQTLGVWKRDTCGHERTSDLG
ncbi:hypothetical protein FQN57_005589 [Myotisia sp. PD_48]|nr:hypothetical protein FQN57_005589 [Myotisia sp. PD_48]